MLAVINIPFNVNCPRFNRSRARGGSLELAITSCSNRASTKTVRRYSIGNLNLTGLFEKAYLIHYDLL